MKGCRTIVALTAVDMPTARWCGEAGVDLVLVGDSLGMVSLGLPDTTSVSMEMMLTATAAASRGLAPGTTGLASPRRPLLVADMPLTGLAAPVENGKLLIAAGAGADCDGQILVLYDLLGIFDKFRPKFARRYAELGLASVDAIRRFAADVRNGEFPAHEESYT